MNTNLTFLQARESPTSSLFGSHEVPRRSRRARGTLRRHRRREKEEAAKMCHVSGFENRNNIEKSLIS